MRANWIRGLGLCLVLAITSLEVAAQRSGPWEPPAQQGPPQQNTCWAGGEDCYFGSAAPCSVTCTVPAMPRCRSASCFLGFPRAAVCHCEGTDPT